VAETKIVHLRLTDEELNLLKELSSNAGQTHSAYVAKLLRQASVNEEGYLLRMAANQSFIAAVVVSQLALKEFGDEKFRALQAFVKKNSNGLFVAHPTPPPSRNPMETSDDPTIEALLKLFQM